MSFLFDPRDLIHGPFIQCPNCGRASEFGVLQVGDHSYQRRCRHCWHTKSFRLPHLTKKVLYLDQFVISEMMKALNPAAKSHGNNPLHKFWLELFERLDRLSKLQVLVCPRSEFHTDESMLSAQHTPLKRLYELLAGDVAFLSRHEIECKQLGDIVKQWITGVPEPAHRLDRQDVMRGELSAWRDRLIISVDWASVDELVKEIRTDRRATHEALIALHESWRTQKKRLPESFQDEWSCYGPAVIEAYVKYARTVGEAQNGRPPADLHDLIPTMTVQKFEYVREILARGGTSVEESFRKTVEFFNSACLQHAPYVRIAAMLFAELAWQAAAGRKPPNEGTITDVNMIATILPYCDGIFVDKAFASILREDFVRQGLDYQTRVFNTTNRDELLAYLDEIEASVSEEHLALVKEVYGPDWPTPFTTLYTYKED
ncbi:MAG TPA: hypothetical protein VNT75_19675 [Symbiobacteriaceae bacterium]|nr:hypothetical protein [Symbiobacteriaceae bacterium]